MNTCGPAATMRARLLAAAVLSLATVLSLAAASCSGQPPRTSAVVVATAPATGNTTGFADNPFIPEDANIGDCVSSLPRPGCGTEASTSGKTALTFGVLMAGMAFIGWRVARGVRQRDRSR